MHCRLLDNAQFLNRYYLNGNPGNLLCDFEVKQFIANI